MNRPARPSRWALPAAALLAAALAGCATAVPEGGATPVESVKLRAAALWKARIGGDFQAMYQLTPPSFRSITAYEKYRGSFGTGAQVTGADVTEVECESADKCTATVKLQALTLFNNQRVPLVTFHKDTWVREQGQWWQFQGQ